MTEGRVETAPPDQQLKGLLLVVLAVFFFAGNDSATKHLAQTLSVPFIIFVRYAVNLLFTAAVFVPLEGPGFMKTTRTWLVALRGLCLAISSLFLGFALQRMQVAEVTAMVFLAPMLVVIVAGPVLGERVAKLDWLAAVLGFAGVLLIARPGGDVDTLGLFYMAIVVATSMSYNLLTRILSKSESNAAMTFYSALAGTIAFGAMLPWTYAGWPHQPLEMVLLLGLGLLAGLGHYFFTSAFSYANASILAPLQYLQMLWAGILGFVVFGNLPGTLSLCGMAIIAASGLLVAYKSKFLSE